MVQALGPKIASVNGMSSRVLSARSPRALHLFQPRSVVQVLGPKIASVNGMSSRVLNRWFRLIKGGRTIKNISGRRRATIENCVATIRGLSGVPWGGRLIKGGRIIQSVLGVQRSYNKEMPHGEILKEMLHKENLKEFLHKGKP